MSRTDKDRHWIIREHDRLTKPEHGFRRYHLCHPGWLKPWMGLQHTEECTVDVPLKKRMAARMVRGRYFCDETIPVASVREWARREKVALRRRRRRVARQMLHGRREYPARLEWVRNAHHD